nr:glycosyltransferase family 2 protein [Pedobacter glucosidilyticus]
MLKHMLISIITSTYNSAALIEDALDSFLIQSYQEKELLVIDGASQDDTCVKVETRMKHQVFQMISEPDKGIYDALNKGIQMAKGDVIGILHSDDVFASPDVLSKVARIFEQEPEVMAVYGDLQYVKRGNKDEVMRNWVSGASSSKKLNWGWMPPHPTLFIRKACFQKYGAYDLQYRSAADYDLILRFLYRYQIKTAYIPEVLVKMRVGGVSNASWRNRWRANQEDRQAMKVNGISYPLFASLWKPLRKLKQFLK